MQIFGENCFDKLIDRIIAFDNESFLKAFEKIEDLRKCPNVFLFGYVRYEAKDIFLGKEIKSDLPILYFEVFEEKKIFENDEVPFENLSAAPLIDFEEYLKQISKIKNEIKLGNTYEVNYTYDWSVKTDLDGFELFKNILPRQKTPYCAFIKNEYEEILSFSPELFFELIGNKIRTKPMKGTVKRGETAQEDALNIEFLKNDEKNRAENVMIVDLLRNDLGLIAKAGSVKADKLFEIETHLTIHQMTSEISAELCDKTTLLDIFKAIFPCGSITGAPKISTMKIIDKIETGKRGVYCGAIGLISAEKTVFSVPIRILSRSNKQKEFLCRVGGAVVWDSTAEEEWQESFTKIGFLNSQFKIVETMCVKNGEVQFFQNHLDRMEKSAKQFGFKFDLSKLRIEKVISDCILRVLLSREGDFEIQKLPLKDLKTNLVQISKSPVKSTEKFIYHKTTYRPWYEKSMEKIKSGEIFDELFFNEREELTEGARSNVVLQIKGELFTPPVKCGLLNGVMRQKLIIDRKIKEKVLHKEDLINAEKIFCVNSVRGIVEVSL